jgi:broad specificity phosphatase PhoE
MKKIYILRHAEVDSSTRHLSLSSEGWQNSIDFGNYLKNQKDFPIPETFYSSDRARSIETARIILMSLGKSQTDLRIENAFGEFNPPAEELAKVEKTEKYTSLKNEGKRSSLYFDWSGKNEAIKTYLDSFDKILTNTDSVLIVSHANIQNFVLYNLFPDDIRVQKNIKTPNLSLTILEKENNTFTLSQISSVNWKLL